MSPRGRPRVLKRPGQAPSFPHDDVGATARDERCGDVLRLDAGERGFSEVDLDLRPRVEAERAGADVTSEPIDLVGREDAATTALAACDALELAELLEGVDPDVRVRANAERDPASAHAL